MRSHRTALAGVSLLLVVFFAPVVMRSHVLFPHDNSVEVGMLAGSSREYRANRTFTDQSCYYIPELERQLNGDHAAWLATWNPCVELGRPAAHTFGFSKAFWLTHALSFATSNPFRLYTLLVMATVALAAFFGLGLLRELGLAPAACFFGASGLATGVFVVYWFSFVMFASTICWSAALAWGIAGWCRRPSWGQGLLVAFATHSLLLTGYPQQIIHHATFLAGFAVLCAWRGAGDPRRLFGALRRAIALLVVGAFGVLSTAPVTLDLIQSARRSARFAFPREYFVEHLPDLADMNVLARFATQLFDAFWWGNPISPRTQFEFVAVSLTPAYAALVLVALFTGRRRGFWVAVVGCAALVTLWPALYGFGVDHLGWNVSRFLPLASAWMPFFVLAAIAADRLIAAPTGWKHPLPWLSLLPLLAVLAGQGLAAEPWRTAIAVLLSLGAAAVCATGRAGLVVVLGAATSLAYGQRLFLARPMAAIHTNSDLVDALRLRTAEGSRYAYFGRPGIPPNVEGLLGLRSIHAFDSMAPLAYQELVAELSVTGMINAGRIFAALDDEARLERDAFSYTGVATIVAERAPAVAGYDVLGRVSRRTLWGRIGGARTEAQIDVRAGSVGARPGSARVMLSGALEDQPQMTAECVDRRDDQRVFRVSPVESDTLLFLSEQHHPAWRATSQGQELETCLVNDFYLGVWLPPGARTVELRFRPAVLWSWLPQLGFALAWAAWTTTRLRSRRPRH